MSAAPVEDRLLLRAFEARALLGVGEKTFRRWVTQGVIPSWTDQETGRRYYPKAQLIAAAAQLRDEVAS